MDIWCFDHFIRPDVYQGSFFLSILVNLGKCAPAVMTTLVRAKIPLEPYNFVTYMLYTVKKKKGSSITYLKKLSNWANSHSVLGGLYPLKLNPPTKPLTPPRWKIFGTPPWSLILERKKNTLTKNYCF